MRRHTARVFLSLLLPSVCVITGCATAPVASSRPFDGGGPGSADAYVAANAPAPSDGIRVHSIQRLADDEDGSLTATVSLRNVSPGPRTVTVAIIWLSRDGSVVNTDPGTTETITLLPQESRELTFSGAPRARDFKVNLTYPGN